MAIIMDLKRIQEDFGWGREGKRGEEESEGEGRDKRRGEERRFIDKPDISRDGYPRM